MDVFTSTSLTDVIASLKAVGYLEAVVGGLTALAFGVAYFFGRAGIRGGDVRFWRSMVTLGPRILLGAIFFVMGGLNGFFQIVPAHPSSLSEPCVACQPFLQGVVSTGYLFPFIKGVELLTGGLLIAGLWVPLATAMLAPIAANIVLYHLFLNPSGLAVAILIAVLYAITAWQQRAAFAPLLRARPTGA